MAPNDIKIVILGQDPYINHEIINDKKIPQADGFAFSVPKTHKPPPSLKNIFKEITNSYSDFKYKNGNLKKWVDREKIFLLNSSLTVKPHNSNSHQALWTEFTNAVIKYISDVNDKVGFILMGNFAKSKQSLIDKKHIIVTSVHPSPLSANNGFFNSKIFEIINNKLKENTISEINWNLS